ncbi:hypothetical protein Pfo_018471 [Paulownia fortunei]|nr:hypothetical protein Pfo_018471 [Paulownia fortunei]
MHSISRYPQFSDLIQISLNSLLPNCFMASFQVDAAQVEDEINEAEETSKGAEVVAATPESFKAVDEEDDGVEGVGAAPPYEEKLENYEDEETEVESPFLEREEYSPLRSAEEPAGFVEFNVDDDDDDEVEDEN